MCRKYRQCYSIQIIKLGLEILWRFGKNGFRLTDSFNSVWKTMNHGSAGSTALPVKNLVTVKYVANQIVIQDKY